MKLGLIWLKTEVISLLSSISGKKVKVKLHGACADCRVNQMTLKNGVETTIKKYAPEIRSC